MPLQQYFGCKSDWSMRQNIFNPSFVWLVIYFILITTILYIKFLLRHFDWLLNINFAVGGKRSE
jgi:hypothetical protein